MVEIGPDRTQIAVMQYSSYTRVEFGFTANPVRLSHLGIRKRRVEGDVISKYTKVKDRIFSFFYINVKISLFVKRFFVPI